MDEDKKAGKEIEVEFIEEEAKNDPDSAPDVEASEEKESHRKMKKSKDDSKRKSEEFQKKYEDLHEQFLRLRAEFANYKKRMEREQIEFSEYLKGEVVKKFLVILDDFDHMIQKSEGEENQKSLLEGAQMIYEKFIGVLKEQGIQRIEALDQEFNPELHEAMLMQPVENSDKNGKVIAVFQEGYVLNNRLLRPSKVVVGEYAEPEDKN